MESSTRTSATAEMRNRPSLSRTWTQRAALLLGSLLIAFTSACGGDSAVDELKSRYIEEGSLSESQAACVAEDMIDEFGAERALSDDEPSSAEKIAIASIALGCGVR